jgi:hypothetical protein
MKINHRLVRVVAVLGIFAAAPLALAAPAHAATDFPPGPGATDLPPGPTATDYPPGPSVVGPEYAESMFPPGPGVAFTSGSTIIAI